MVGERRVGYLVTALGSVVGGVATGGAASTGVTFGTGAELRTPSFPVLAPVTAEQGGEVVLVGRLVWDDRDLGWATQWAHFNAYIPAMTASMTIPLL